MEINEQTVELVNLLGKYSMGILGLVLGFFQVKMAKSDKKKTVALKQFQKDLDHAHASLREVRTGTYTLRKGPRDPAADNKPAVAIHDQNPN